MDAQSRLKELLNQTPADDAGRQTVANQLLALLLEHKEAGGTIKFLPARSTVASPAPLDRDAQRQVLAEIITLLKPIAPDDETEILRLHAAIKSSDTWRQLSREDQRIIVSMVVTRLRRLQDDRHLIHPRLEEAFSMLSAFSKREQPGYVVGLSRNHSPVRGSWQEDAKQWWELLTAAATPKT